MPVRTPISIGMHRIGLVLAVPIATLALVGAAVIYFGTLLATGLNLKATLKR